MVLHSLKAVLQNRVGAGPTLQQRELGSRTPKNASEKLGFVDLGVGST